MKLKTKILTTVTALILGATFTFNAGAISTDLHTAVKDGNIEKVRGLYKEHPEWVTERDEHYCQPISYAQSGEITKYLIEHGACVNDALYSLPFNGLGMNSESIRYLAEHGAGLGICLAYAVHINDLDLVEYLIERGADPNDGLAPACYDNHLDLFKYFVEHGANKKSALDDAIWDYNMGLIKYLVEECGADPNDGLTTAFNENKLDLFKYFAEHGANKELALNYAISSNNIDLVKYLLNLFEHFVKHNADKKLALDYSISGNNIDLVKYLVEERGAVASEGLFRALCMSNSGVNNMDVLEYLVQHGADVNDGFNYCLGGNNFKLAKWFIDHGADVNRKDKNSDTLLHALVSGLNGIEHGTDKYPFITDKNESRKKLRAIIDFLRANGAHE